MPLNGSTQLKGGGEPQPQYRTALGSAHGSAAEGRVQQGTARNWLGRRQGYELKGAGRQ